MSTSVLSSRLALLEKQGVLTQKVLSPPAASTVYELTDRGRALEPALLALIRWGALMMTSPRKGEHYEPDWLRLAAEAFARTGPTPELSFEIRATGDGPEVVFRGRGGPSGTQIGLAGDVDDSEVDVRVTGPATVLLAYLARGLSRKILLENPEVVVSGNKKRIAELPGLFDIPSDD